MTWDEARELAEMAIADREGTGMQLVDRVANAILAAAGGPPADGAIPILVDPRLEPEGWGLHPHIRGRR